MSYKRSAPRIDIRHLPVSKVTRNSTTLVDSTAPLMDADDNYRPGKDVRMIAFLVVPLVVLLIVGFYYDRSHSWVVEFATYLFKLGK